MNRIIQSTFVVAIAFVLVADARAVPVQGQYVDDSRCDTVPNTFLSHELGDAAVFPINEGLSINVQQTTNTTCVGNDGQANDWVVRIVNVSGIAWQDLHLVVDQFYTVGNSDGAAQDITVPGYTDAFRIDGTVTPGVNNPLLLETGIVNEILEPGESWEFLMTNFSGGPPMFDSVGGFAASSAAAPPSTASILANPVPEPASIGLLALGGLWVMRSRRSRALA